MAEDLLDLMGGLEDGSEEDIAQTGVAVENIDNIEMERDIPMTATGIVDIDHVLQPSHLNALQHLSLWRDDTTINVITGSTILNDDDFPPYFTAAFPIIFPWGTEKHIDNWQSKPSLSLKKWVQLLLRNSSRYPLKLIIITPRLTISSPSWICHSVL